MNLLFALACARPSVAPPPTPTTPTSLAATATPTLLEPSVVDVTFSTAAPADGWVEYGENGATSLVSPHDAGGTDHRVRLLGLAYGAEITWKAVAAVDGERVESPLSTLTLADADAAVPPLVVDVVDPSRSEVASSWIWVATQGASSWFAIYDGSGRPTWVHRTDDGRVAAALQPAVDGDGLFAMDEDLGFDTTDSVLRRLDWSGEVLSTTELATGHHTFVQQPDGRIGFSGLQFGTGTAYGLTEDVLTDTVGTIAERGVSGDEALVFHFLDDWVPFYVPCIHTAEPQDIWGRTDLHEWTHVNSLTLSDDGASWFVGVRLPDAVLKMDVASGAVAWQAGGRDSDLAFEDPADAWSHGHFSDTWADHLLMFDNGTHAVPPASRVVEYRFDEVAGTIEKIWEYDEPTGALVTFLGDARRLPRGNTLITWTSLGRMDEVTPDGEVVWTATMADDDSFPGRTLLMADPYTPRTP